ncbi:uncharacterized protein PAE49_023018 [Odontesthes bonariensis]|uniref:uncharacterized protein LOC142371382 n=1 Tax=Odontesthes bonariensis TaxID=219752 RepID=UPI003F58CAC9
MKNCSFDKMTPKSLLTLLGIIPYCIGQINECSLRDINCSDIKTSAGYKFEHECPLESSIYVNDDNETTIAYAKPSKGLFRLEQSGEVDMDNSSVTTKSCRNLTVKCILHSETGVNEKCFDFKVNTENPDGSFLSSQWSRAAVIAIAIGVAGTLCACYASWRRELKKQNNKATLSGFLRYVLTCSCLVTRDSSQGSDLTGNANASVDERGFGRYQFSRCITAPTDVELTSNGNLV